MTKTSSSNVKPSYLKALCPPPPTLSALPPFFVGVKLHLFPSLFVAPPLPVTNDRCLKTFHPANHKINVSGASQISQRATLKIGGSITCVFCRLKLYFSNVNEYSFLHHCLQVMTWQWYLVLGTHCNTVSRSCTCGCRLAKRGLSKEAFPVWDVGVSLASPRKASWISYN